MILLENLSLLLGSKAIFKDARASIGPRDRIGLVGSNGAGKSTLLRVLNNEQSVDAGKIDKAGYVSIGYLPQDFLILKGRSVFAEVESAFQDVVTLQKQVDEASARLESLSTESKEYLETLELIGGWEHRLEELDAHRVKVKVEKVLLGLGFSSKDLTRDTGEFSGGWQMRIALAKLLLQEPSLLLLDEPTNHLDLDSVRWLENYLRKYEGAVMLVSHDRAFLDALTNRTFSLSQGRLESYSGNYSFFEKEHLKRKEVLVKAQANQQRKLEKTQEFIDRFRSKATKAKQVQSRVKALEKIELIELEDEEEQIAFSFPEPPRSGQTVLEIENLTKAYGDLVVMENIGFRLERGDRIAIVGVNGAGKSTLSRILAGVEPYQKGERTIGHNVSFSYFAQHQADELDPQLEALEVVESVAAGGDRNRGRSLLGAFLFKGDDVFKKVSVLSGGEKNRLALAKILLQPFNCLILDEPTNHLDMRSKGVLQEALKAYEGTYLIVSHDRAFLDPLVNKVIEVSKRNIRTFHGNVSDYVAKIDAEAAARQAAGTNQPVATENKNNAKAVSGDPRVRRQMVAARNLKLAPLRKKSEVLENQIQEFEAQVEVTEKEMLDPDFFKQGEATQTRVNEYEKIKRRLERTYADWERLTEEIDQIESRPLESFV